MQRSLKSDGLKVEKLNTKLDFKSARVTQDYRAIFTQSGNTVLLVYIDHHDDAYSWATRRIQGFDVESVKPVYSYYANSQLRFDPLTGEFLGGSNPAEHPGKEGKVRPVANKAPFFNVLLWMIVPLLFFALGILMGAFLF